MTGVRGVQFHRQSGLWMGRVTHFGKMHVVGYFKTIEAAEVAVIAKRNELFTHNDADRQVA